MTELVLMRGYSGSGKSTLARSWVSGAEPGTRIRVSRDDIRAMLTGSSKKTVLDYEGEQAVTRIQRTAARDALKAGKDVVVDDTNLVLRFAREWAALASDEGATFRVWDVQTPLGDCLYRNEQRLATGDSVPEHVIHDQAKRFPFKNWQEVTPKQKEHSAPPAVYVPNPDLPDAIIVDIDGTLAHKHPDRDIYDGHLAYLDGLDTTVCRIVNWADMEGINIIVMSGRDSKYREVTESWLYMHMIPYVDLHMRAEGDNRPDFVVKGELFDEHLRDNYNVLFALDDRDQIVKLWRDMGVKCLQVEYGAF